MLIDLGQASLNLSGGFSTVRGLAFGTIYVQSFSAIPVGGNMIVGNFIGADATGRIARTNSSGGIQISGSPTNQIGGIAPAERNLISGGAGISSDSPGTVVQGNYIGTDVTGAEPLGNSGAGITFQAPPPSGGLIGGTNSGAGNVIAFNWGPGVWLRSGGAGDSVLGNSIFGNSGIGIDIGGPGSVSDPPFTNSVGGLQNAPVITNVLSTSGGTTIQGSLQAGSNLVYRLEIFSSPAPTNAFYSSEGRTLLGAVALTTDASGRAGFSVTFTAPVQVASATATDPFGNTSSFFMFDQRNPGCFQAGDLFVGFYNGSLQWRRNSGLPVAIVFEAESHLLTGLGFSPAGPLFAVDSTAGELDQFDPCGLPLSPLLAGTNTMPTAICFDAAGGFYLGFYASTNNVWNFDASGNRVRQYTVAVENSGIDWIDLAADQRTLYYTSYGPSIKRFDLVANVQLPDLVTNLAESQALRLLPNGGLLVGTEQGIYRLDDVGNLLQTYLEPSVYTWSGISLDPDGHTFWALGSPAVVFHFDLASGAVLASFRVDDVGNAASLLLKGEVTAALSGPAAPSLAIFLSGNAVVLSWPNSATGFTLQTSAKLGSAANWQADLEPVIVLDGRNMVTNNIGPSAAYYRLLKQ